MIKYLLFVLLIQLPSIAEDNPLMSMKSGLNINNYGWSGTIFKDRDLLINSVLAIEGFRSIERAGKCDNSATIQQMQQQIDFLQKQNQQLLEFIMKNKENVVQ